MTRDVAIELKGLRLHGMAGAWIDLTEQGTLRWSARQLVVPGCRGRSPETTLEGDRCRCPGTRSAVPCCLGLHRPLRPPAKRLRSSIDQRCSSLVFQEIACPHGCMRVGQEDITHPRGSWH
jgi:hypothetical protein